MTEHLPECWAKHDSDPPAWCICDELRACEERVQKIAYRQGLGAGSDEHRQHEAGFVKGYAAALDTARDAVTAIESDRDALVWWERFGDNPDNPDEVTVLIDLNRAIAVIDALRENQ